MGLLEQNAYKDRRTTDLDCFKEAIIKELDKIPQKIIDKCNNAFKPRLRCVIDVEGWHIERYLLLITQIDTPPYVFLKYDMILINQKRLLQFH